MKALFASLVAAMLAAAPAAAIDQPLPQWTATDVSIGEGDGALHGTYIAPGPHKSAFDAVLIISGSGPTDRDGNQNAAKNDSLKMVAEALGFADIATLRVDKRGVGASAKAMTREEDLRFETYVDDAKAWLAFLKAQPGVERVFVIGHSEGALIGALAAEGADVAGYVSLAGPGQPAAEALRRQLKAAPNGDQILALAEPTLAKLEKGETDPNPSPLLYSLFRPSVQPYLISWFRYDPRVEIAKLPGRVLIVQGTTDIQVETADAEMLKAARPDATLTLIERMNHVLKVAPAERLANAKTYTDPSLPLAPGLMDALTAFVQIR